MIRPSPSVATSATLWSGTSAAVRQTLSSSGAHSAPVPEPQVGFPAGPPPMTSAEPPLMRLLAGAPAAVKSSFRAPLLTVVLPV